MATNARQEEQEARRRHAQDDRAGSRAKSQQRRQALQGIRQIDRQLARDMSGARLRTLRAVQAASRMGRAQMRAQRARAYRIGWMRPPREKEIRLAGIRRGRLEAGADGKRSVHFALSHTGSGGAASSHQKYVERDRACVASFGTIHQDPEERARLWTEIGERSTAFSGSVELRPGTDPELKKLFRDRAPDLVAEGLIAEKEARALAIMKDASLDKSKLFVRTQGKDSHNRLVRWLKEAQTRLEEDGKAGKSEFPAGKATRWLPAGVRDMAPRETIVQRRLVLELPHELPLEAQERALRAWCEEHLEGSDISHHAVIHRPEGRNDPRNWHSHVVMVTFPLQRRDDDSGWTFEDAEPGRRLPGIVPAMRDLRGNGPDKKKGSIALVRRWRSGWADALNRELARSGAEKRYDPRSHKDRGILEEPGEHMGPKRHALEMRRQADHWNQAPPDWGSLPAEDPLLGEADGPEALKEALREEIRLKAGLAQQGLGPGHPAWDCLEKGFQAEPADAPLETQDQELAEGFSQWLSARQDADAAWQAEWEGAKRRRKGWALLSAARHLKDDAGGTDPLAAMAERKVPGAKEAGGLAQEWKEKAKPWQRRWSSVDRRPRSPAKDKAAAELARQMSLAGIEDPLHVLDTPQAGALIEAKSRHDRTQAAQIDIRRTDELGRRRDPDLVQARVAGMWKEHGRWLRRDAPHAADWLQGASEGWIRAATLRGEADRRQGGGKGEPLCAIQRFHDPSWTCFLEEDELPAMLAFLEAPAPEEAPPELPLEDPAPETPETPEAPPPDRSPAEIQRIQNLADDAQAKAKSPEEADIALEELLRSEKEALETAGKEARDKAHQAHQEFVRLEMQLRKAQKRRSDLRLEAQLEARLILSLHRKGQPAQELVPRVQAFLQDKSAAGPAALLKDLHLAKLEGLLKEAGHPDAQIQRMLEERRQKAKEAKARKGKKGSS